MRNQRENEKAEYMRVQAFMNEQFLENCMHYSGVSFKPGFFCQFVDVGKLVNSELVIVANILRTTNAKLSFAGRNFHLGLRGQFNSTGPYFHQPLRLKICDWKGNDKNWDANQCTG